MKQYYNYLSQVVKEYRQTNSPISKEMLIRRLSSRFNLSPDYCRTIVTKWINLKGA